MSSVKWLVPSFKSLVSSVKFQTSKASCLPAGPGWAAGVPLSPAGRQQGDGRRPQGQEPAQDGHHWTQRSDLTSLSHLNGTMQIRLEGVADLDSLGTDWVDLGMY